MKKIIYLFLAISIMYSCSDSESEDASIPELDSIIGVWTLTNEEWTGAGNWPDGQARGCFMSSDEGSPDQLIFTENSVIKNVWECFQDGSLAEDMVVYGPLAWNKTSDNTYLVDGTVLGVTFIGNSQMQLPFDVDILQTWVKN